VTYHGRYDYPGTWINDYPPITVSKELGIGRWWGSEARLVSTHFKGHKLMLGSEFQANETLAWSLVSTDPYDPETSQSFTHATDRYGLYLQDEVALSKNIILNAGLRYDHLSYANDDINPRLALIYKPWENTAFKLLYGSSFRAPNSNELYYSDSITIASIQLNPEHIKTYEGIIEYQVDRSLRLTALGFHYEIDNLIQLQEIISPRTGEVEKSIYQFWSQQCLRNRIRIRKTMGLWFPITRQLHLGGSV
jgi:Outer membrane receptor proteins, mostly Fe transport